jgi:hypothetical protein
MCKSILPNADNKISLKKEKKMKVATTITIFEHKQICIVLFNQAVKMLQLSEIIILIFLIAQDNTTRGLH